MRHEDERAFEDLWRYLGLSVDWRSLYTTIGEKARRASQKSFLRLLHRGEAYAAEAPTLWDIDFRTAVAQAELVWRKSAGYAQYVNSSGWYVLGGYRLGQVLPYVSYASTTKSTQPDIVGALSYDQRSQTLGVRWDAFKSADLKFQLERVDPRGTTGISFTQTAPGFGDKTVTVMSLALDFVF